MDISVHWWNTGYYTLQHMPLQWLYLGLAKQIWKLKEFWESCRSWKTFAVLMEILIKVWNWLGENNLQSFFWGREGQETYLKQAESNTGLYLRTLRSWPEAEIKSWKLNCLRHPVTPHHQTLVGQFTFGIESIHTKWLLGLCEKNATLHTC